MTRRPHGALLGLVTALVVSSCGAGVAGVVAGTSDGGGGGTPTVLTSFQALDLAGIPTVNPKVSPATLRLGVSGTAPVRIGLFYRRSGQLRQPMTKLGTSGNTVVLAAPGTDLAWDFAAEPSLDGERLVEGVELTVEFPGGTIPDGGVLELGIGNDVPAIEEVVAPTGVRSGVVPVGVRVSDSSSDVISIALEWRRQGESDDEWKPATPASVFGEEDPLEGIQASPEGVARTFSWNTAIDLLDQDADVELRFTPDDGTRDAAGNPVGRGESVRSPPFRIENRGKPILIGFQVLTPKVSPARLRLSLVQAQSEPVDVGFFFQVPGGPELPMTELQGAAGNSIVLPSSPVGAESELAWDFAAEPALPGGAFVPGVALVLRSGDGPVLSGGVLVAGLGNDPPALAGLSLPDPEVASIVPIRLRVADTSSDAVAIRVEFDVLGDAPDAGFRSARPAGLEPTTPTPDLAVSGILAPPDGLELVFFWDTDFDLADLERDVVLRLRATDELVEGEPLLSAPFRVDNNAAPIVQIFNDLVVTNPDERRGIPIPYRVIDEESDPTEVIFQWRREGEVFPELPSAAAELDALLADPEQRAAKHVCTSYPRFARGRALPVDAGAVRLPELASSESWILARGLVGRQLELLRPSQMPAPITPSWAQNPLVAPIAALPVADGLTALVLDAPGGNGRLREIELATGSVVREVAGIGPGLPSAMAFEPSERSVLVATSLGGVWHVGRIELATGGVIELHVAGATAQAGPIRGLAALGPNVAIATVGSSLVMLDHADPLAPREVTLLTNLATPWGIAVDPLNTNQIYLAERDAVTSAGTGRILAVELDSFERVAVVARTQPLPGIAQPSALALARNGARLLAITGAPGQGRRLVGLDLGRHARNSPFALGLPVQGELTQVASGPDGLLLLAFPGANELLVGGGLEQHRVITALDPGAGAGAPRRQLAILATPLEPPARPGQAWRIPDGPRRDSTPVGVDTTFLWDSADAGDGDVFFRALPRDDATGTAAVSMAPKAVRPSLDVDALVLGDPVTTSGPRFVSAADLDGDGDSDLVSANQLGSSLTVFFQESPKSFTPEPLVLGSVETTGSPRSVATADLDGDGDLDLASANANRMNLTVFFQGSPGIFAASPLVLGGAATTEAPIALAAADLDGDGDLDLVSANFLGDDLSVFFQDSPGRFAIPLVLGSPTATIAPSAVATVDFDGDGDLDIVSGNSGLSSPSGGGDALTVFLQVRPREFAPASVLGSTPLTNDPVSLAAADLDGDGDQDLVSANAGRDDLMAFFQRSPGSFGDPQALGGSGTTDSPFSVAAADLDGDGDQDLVAANRVGDDLTVFLQESSGGLVVRPQALGGPTTDAPTSVAAADLDGDGDHDLVSANFDGSNLTVFFQASPGAFDASPRALGGFPTTNAPFSFAAADFDGDGDQDLVSANADGNNLTVFLQELPGNFGASPGVLGGPSRTKAPFSVAAADLDGDGDQDFVSANHDGDNLTVFFQESPGSFRPNPHVRGGTATTPAPLSVAAADLDGDGDQDFVSANVGAHDLTVFFQESPGRFSSSPDVLGGFPTTITPFAIAAADLDGDGDVDLVSANAGGNDLTVFLQESRGTFGASPLVIGGSTTRAPFSVAAADLDGDGDVDLVSANTGGDDLTVFAQESPGSFARNPRVIGRFPTIDAPVSVAAADLDADGDEDLLSANAGGHDLTLFSHDSPGVFTTSPRRLGGPAITFGPRFVRAADLDGDGDLDLVSANEFGHDLRVFWGGR